jgi:hypothetical protein
MRAARSRKLSHDVRFDFLEADVNEAALRRVISPRSGAVAPGETTISDPHY